MEATVRILNQSPLMTRQYMDKKTGEQKVINFCNPEVNGWLEYLPGRDYGRASSKLPEVRPAVCL